MNSPYPAATDFAPTAIAGGGFLQSPGFDTPTQKTFKGGDVQTLTPLTVKMMWNAAQGADETFRVDGQPLVQITFVAKVLAVDSTNSTNITYTVDDGTGIIVVKVWLETDDSGQTQKGDVIEVNKYVRVYGHLRNWQSTLNVVAFRLHRIENSNEITYHFLEVIRVHLFHTKGPLPPTTQADTQAVVQSPAHSPAPALQTPQRSATQLATDFNEIQRSIIQVLRLAPNKDKGYHKQEIVDALNCRYLEQDVLVGLNYLVSEGHVFNTASEFHFAVSTNL